MERAIEILTAILWSQCFSLGRFAVFFHHTRQKVARPTTWLKLMFQLHVNLYSGKLRVDWEVSFTVLADGAAT